MSEIKTVVCPNCGANTTNTQNCEYCGSLLVRFADKGIDLSNTSYTSNDEVIPGLIEELKKNLELQRNNIDCNVNTCLYSDSDRFLSIEILRKGYSDYEDKFDDKGKEGFVIVLDFSKVIYGFRFSEEEADYINKVKDVQLNRFRHLVCYSLFTVVIDGNNINYVINFGTDIEGAARLVSELWYKVLGHSVYDNVEFETYHLDNSDSDTVSEDNSSNDTSYDDTSNDDTYEEEEEDSGILKWLIKILYYIGLAVLYFIAKAFIYAAFGF